MWQRCAFPITRNFVILAVRVVVHACVRPIRRRQDLWLVPRAIEERRRHERATLDRAFRDDRSSVVGPSTPQFELQFSLWPSLCSRRSIRLLVLVRDGSAKRKPSCDVMRKRAIAVGLRKRRVEQIRRPREAAREWGRAAGLPRQPDGRTVSRKRVVPFAFSLFRDGLGLQHDRGRPVAAPKLDGRTAGLYMPLAITVACAGRRCHRPSCRAIRT